MFNLFTFLHVQSTVLMFSHYINHLQNNGALEGHRTLMVHKCLTVASALSHFYWWQRRVQPGDKDKLDWVNVPIISKGNFCYKYSPALVLMGSAQHPVYAHPKMLGPLLRQRLSPRTPDRGDLLARGKNPTEAQTKKVYDQQYEAMEITPHTRTLMKIALKTKI